jgi:hypothetical protein
MAKRRRMGIAFISVVFPHLLSAAIRAMRTSPESSAPTFLQKRCKDSAAAFPSDAVPESSSIERDWKYMLREVICSKVKNMHSSEKAWLCPDSTLLPHCYVELRIHLSHVADSIIAAAHAGSCRSQARTSWT